MATSVPAPMAMPTSARARAGASLMPSPTMATRRPCRAAARGRRSSLWLGQHAGDDLVHAHACVGHGLAPCARVVAREHDSVVAPMTRSCARWRSALGRLHGVGHGHQARIARPSRGEVEHSLAVGRPGRPRARGKAAQVHAGSPPSCADVAGKARRSRHRRRPQGHLARHLLEALYVPGARIHARMGLVSVARTTASCQWVLRLLCQGLRKATGHVARRSASVTRPAASSTSVTRRLAGRDGAGLVQHHRSPLRYAVSSASADLMSTPFAAPRPVPTMMAVGVARPSAQGHADDQDGDGVRLSAVAKSPMRHPRPRRPPPRRR